MILAVLLASCHTVPDHSRHSDCVECHSPQVEEWLGSRHAVAYENETFQRSWAEEQDPWCLTCHLPDDGVTCATCHGLERKTCADCHEFDLPRELPGTPSGTLAQSTVSEWRGSGAAAQRMGCVDCHPAHHPIGGNDRERVREVISATVVAHGDRVIATLTADEIGHAFPTGDPFRRLELTLCADLACAQPLTQISLERRLERTEDGGWAVDQDTRIPAPTEGLRGTRTIHLNAPQARAWRLTMHLADPAHAADLSGHAAYVVDTGTVERP